MHVLLTLLFTNTACAGGTTEEVFVPAGKYWSYKGAGVKPVAVHIADFYMDTFPVSIAQYTACIQKGKCPDSPIYRFIKYREKTFRPQLESPTGYPDTYAEALQKAALDPNKMTYVTAHEAEAYCASQGKRLPTLAEWAKAARGADTTHKYPWGDTPPPCTHTQTKICPGGDALAKNTHFAPSPYGIYGMLSDFAELTLDIYHQKFTVTSSTPNPLCTREMYKKFPLWKESTPMSRPTPGRVSTFSGAVFLSIEGGYLLIEDESDGYTSFRCVRSKLMQPEDFNK